jgi:hypothetical protein
MGARMSSNQDAYDNKRGQHERELGCFGILSRVVRARQGPLQVLWQLVGSNFAQHPVKHAALVADAVHPSVSSFGPASAVPS